MSGNPPTIEWYIARDGAQHGPISDAEMIKFVELGHLRPADLVWCARFTQWQTGAQAFPDQIKPQPAVTPTANIQPANTQSPTAPTAAAPAFQQPAPSAQALSQAREDVGWADAMRPVANQPAQDTRGGRQKAPTEPASPAFDAAMQDRHAYDGEQALHDQDLDREEAPVAGRKRGWLGIATAALAVLLIVGGLGWVAWQNRTLVSGASAIGTALKSTVSGGASSEYLRTSPYIAAGETKTEIDASLQKVEVWRFVKREFADVYQDVLADVERMRNRKNDEREITQYFVNVIVTLRRKHALAALQASPEHLRGMALAFVANLKQLGSRDGATCYAFVTHGEASPFMIELSKTPAFAESLQKQMIAVLSAVIDARAARKIHANTRRSDYDVLTEQLTTQRGWSQQDLATFSDPKKLSTTLPDKVCTLVQDWFVMQLSLKDPELQSRLLAESLKPLVGG